MDVLLLGASGRIGQRVTTELLDRGHAVTGVSRSGTIEDIEDPDLVTVAGNATGADDIAKLVTGHDAVASTLGPGEDEDPEVLMEMMTAVVEGQRRASVDRLVWTGAGGLEVAPGTKLVADEEGDSHISVEDFAIALVDELESGDGVHSYVGTGY